MAARALKAHFIGIDQTIDELIDAMRVWYLMPQALTRPVIINLWGMTGVGKTDLVRRLVSALDMQDRFVEVELSNGDETKWFSSVGSVLSSNALNDTAEKIVLFDEIQRFSTLDDEAKPLINTKFSDFWELLSDGRLSRREREDIEYLLSEVRHADREAQWKRDRGEEVEESGLIGVYMARQIKDAIELEEELHEVAAMSRNELVRRLEDARFKKRVYEPVDHSKTLIIVSGNLDEAFTMAMRTDEADVDADIFSAFTEKVTVIDIKTSLTSRFKPEQVARFGNIHIIYRSLRHRDFVELIAREIDRIVRNVQRLFGVRVSVSDSVKDLIYRNGVFPVQGVRPVYSSISDILESNLSRYLLEELLLGEASIAVDYDVERSLLVATLSAGQIVETPYVGRLDRARRSNRADVVANVSTHEAGHAVAYAVLFGLAPLQLVSRIASTSAAGFTFPHEIHETRDSLLAMIKVYLAGGVAEELIFGIANASTGRLNDRERATSIALDFVRRYGFDAEFSANYTLPEAHAMSMTVTDIDAEKMLSRLESETRELLLEWKPLLVDMARSLQNNGKLDGESVAAIARPHGLDIRVEPEGFLHAPSYAAQLKG